MAHVIVGLLSIGAGVAIAGLPNNVPVDATIIPPATTEAPAPTVPERDELIVVAANGANAAGAAAPSVIELPANTELPAYIGRDRA